MQISGKILNYALREAQPFPSTSMTLDFSTFLSENGKVFIKLGKNTGLSLGCRTAPKFDNKGHWISVNFIEAHIEETRAHSVTFY